MRAQQLAWGVLAVAVAGGRLAALQSPDRPQLERIEQALQQEGQAIVGLAEATGGHRPDPTDFSLTWHNDFLKARAGTFVPFIVGVAAQGRRPPAALLLYIRVARRASGDGATRGASQRIPGGSEGTAFPFEEIYPVDLASRQGQPVRIARGFSVAPGEYNLTVVVRERGEDRGRRRMAAVLRRPFSVPDYSTPELTTSTIILADGLIVLDQAPAPRELAERPYVIGVRDIQPAVDRLFRRNEELVVVFLVYNPSVTPDKHFDLEVEYYFFRKSGAAVGVHLPAGKGVPAALPGETYVNRTESQRFNPAVLGPRFDHAAGQPVMAGQGVPLAGFQEGDYRLAITVSDLISGRSLERHTTFTVGP